MKGLRATESHSADRAAQPKQKVNQAAELENKVELESCRFKEIRLNERPGRPSGFLWHGAPS